jgi:Ca2+-binding RTX toxin-like protein
MAAPVDNGCLRFERNSLMRTEISSRFFTILGDIVNNRGVYDVTPRHQAAIDALPSTGPWQPVSLSASQIVSSRPGGYTLTLAGSGISPVSSLDELGEAIDAGIASGALSSLTLARNGTELARLTLQPSGWTLVSDTLSLAVTGAVPTTLDQAMAIAEAAANAMANPAGLQTLLNSYAITGLSLVNAGTELIGLSLTAAALTLRVVGATATLPGSFATRLGDFLAAVERAEDAAGWYDDWVEILLLEEFAAGDLTIRDAGGATILSVSEATEPLHEDFYFLIDQRQWVLRSWLDMNWDALVEGRMQFPLATPNDDRISVSGSDALVIAGAGNDSITTGAGHDMIQGNADNDFIIAGAGNDTIETGTGNDTVWAGTGDDSVWVQGGNSEVWSGLGNDSLTGGSGNDTLGAGGGDDFISAVGGVNQLWAGAGRDTVYGANNGDQIGGAAGDDVVYAGSGADAIYLGAGNDQAYGGAGNDTIFAGPGFDRMWGGAGADRFEFYRNYGWNRVEDFSAGDGDTLALARGLWLGAGTLSAAQVVTRFGSLNAAGDAVLNFGTADTTIVIVGAGTLDGLADQITIL